MAKENTEETRLEAKKSRYSAVSIIMREMYGTKFGYMPGYILLQDVFYKHFKEKEMPVEELIKWAISKFVMDLDYDEALEEIMLIVTQNLPESKGNNISLLDEALERASDLYDKQICYSRVVAAVREIPIMNVLERDIIRILFEIKRGKTLPEALEKLATEDTDPKSKQLTEDKNLRKLELTNAIFCAFGSDVEMLEFAENNIDVSDID
ncbi:MAG TPA: hypothetical protein OIM48_07185 [Clostridiaceae bacterium]|jgi:hypothetical protein|nr:hypothetical protein [Clostridium sp.]MEE0126980.1 hypothetical protein [Clostridia bacterium]HJJ13061.1 hypothetical protein [Clostridiaceae bacterium]